MPNPTPAFIHDPDDAPLIRRLECAGYDGCLTFAYRAKWRGFGCNCCPAFEPQSREQTLSDIDAIMALVCSALKQGRFE